VLFLQEIVTPGAGGTGFVVVSAYSGLMNASPDNDAVDESMALTDEIVIQPRL
jgi:hypothetical protein